MARPPAIAAVEAADSAAVQRLFSEAAAHWRAQGLRVAGVVAEPHGLENRSCSSGYLRDLATDTAFRIYLDEAPGNTSCHLDAEGARAACAALLPQIASCDVVVLSKFGKLEAASDGLAPAFAAAIAAGKPVLTTVSAKHRAAWAAFAPDAAVLPAENRALQTWKNGLPVRTAS